MPTVTVDTRTLHTNTFSFRPQGKNIRYGTLSNPLEHIASVTWSARLIIGFDVGHKPTWNLSDIVKLVKKHRKDQGADPDATFFATRGLYTERKHTRGKTRSRVIDENGCQVVIINLGEPQTLFRKEMIEMAEKLTRELKQDKIYLEFQRNGISKGVWEVTP